MVEKLWVFDNMVEKLWVSASQNFLWIENQLNIKKLMSKDVCVCSFPIFDIFDIHSITALICIWSILDTFDIALIYLNTSIIKQYVLTHTL